MKRVTAKHYSFSNENFSAKLTKQALHMDQGVCYNPEYLALRSMSHYPSRVAQIIRAVYLGELEASKRGADILSSPILSGQGERWQNFSEEPSDFLHCVILGRELFSERGFSAAAANLELPASPGRDKLWAKSVTICSDGDCHLFIDDASFEYTGDSPWKLGKFLDSSGVRLIGYSSSSTGFAHLAHGLVEEGIGRLGDLLDKLNATGARKVITVSGQGTYALTALADLFGIPRTFDVVDLLDIASGINSQRAFLYGGSFYTRYLKMSSRLNELSANSWEKPIQNTPEFFPLYDADKRLNDVNIWGAPIGPEYVNKHTGGDILEKIQDAALSEISRVPFSQLIICEPFAYNILKNIGYASGKLAYFWNLLT